MGGIVVRNAAHLAGGPGIDDLRGHATVFLARRGHVDRLRPGVVEVELVTFAEPLAHGPLHGVIIAGSAAAIRGERRVLAVEQCIRSQNTA